MLAQLWPNKIGYDVGDAEVWIMPDTFAVHTRTRVLRVPFAITRDPVFAVELCNSCGVPISELEGLEYHEAQAAYTASAARLEAVHLHH